MSASRKWLSRLLLGAVALGGGAGLALLTPPPPHAKARAVAASRVLPAMPPVAPALATVARLPEPEAVQPAAIEASEEHAPPPVPAEPGLSPEALALGGAYKDGMIITGSTPHRLILFTFDDGPDTTTTPLLLDRLDEAGIKAVFFLVASRFSDSTPLERRQAAVAREIMRRGHLIGGHTLDHVQLPLLDDAEVKRQLSESDAIFERVLGSRAWLFRPPFGAHSQRVDQLIAARGYTSVLWNLGAGDFQVRTAEEVYRTWLKVFERREREFGDRGGIVLLHDTHAWSVDAFQMIVSHLLQRNCELFEQDGEELYDFVDDLTYFYVPRGDAVAEAEAPAMELAPELLAERQARLRESTARRCRSLAAAY
jgi:peptidoglycan/xylan/chitin deacetylase (PgdA/CDA1 family)